MTQPVIVSPSGKTFYTWKTKEITLETVETFIDNIQCIKLAFSVAHWQIISGIQYFWPMSACIARIIAQAAAIL